MTTPTLPQFEDGELQAERARALAWAKTVYAWTHSHVYQTARGQTQTLSGLPMLAVDADHSFPSSQNPTAVQIFEIVSTVSNLLGLLIFNVTDLVDVGAVRRDGPPPASFLASTAPASSSPTHTLRGELHERLESVGKAIDVFAKHVEHADDALKCWRWLADLRRTLSGLLDRLESAIHDLEGPSPDLLGDVAIAANNEVGRLFRFLVDGDSFAPVLERAGLRGPARSLEQFGRQFQTFPVPNVSGNGMSDDVFARMRIAGPNPLLLTRVNGALPDNFPVSPARVEALTGQSIEAAMATGRAYLVDYAPLANVVAGDQPAGQKYICAPLALFLLDEQRRRLRPVAIQLGQQPDTQVPIFYPDDGSTWELAKLHLQSADGNYHELISHLGLTHLLVEPFVVATHRNLAQYHPVFCLLLPHFQGTLFINWSAVVSLIAPGGGVDQLLAGTIESDWEVVGTTFASLDFNAHMLPNDLRARGVSDPELLPDYPYRDDALLLWEAIERWVTEYLYIYYDNDEAVTKDSEIQSWYADIVSPHGGCVKGFGETGDGGEVGLFTRDYLGRVLTMLIFTASVQHATVNFPQLSIMSYTPAMPLATYAPPPVAVDPELSAEAILSHLPPLQLANYQLMLGQMLGGVYFTRLGRYDLQQAGPWFQDPRVSSPLERFQARLGEVERLIAARNLERPPYEILLPSRIPQSINI